MGNLTYKMFRLCGRPFAFRPSGLEHLLPGRPGLFLGNHAGEVGPIQAVLSMPVRFYPWLAAEMADPQRAPKYLYDDFTRPVLHLGLRAGMALSRVITAITVRLFRNIGAIPVDRLRGQYLDAFRASLARLEAGGYVLIFPEDPDTPPDPRTGMRAFMFGNLYLAHLYRRATGQDLPVYPLAIIPRAHRVVLGEPCFYGGSGSSRAAILALSQQVNRAIAELYLANN